MTIRRANRRAIATTAIGSIVAGLLLAAFGVTSAPAGAAPLGKVDICHATGDKTAPYEAIEVNANSVDGGHGHAGHTGPVFDFTHPAANEGWGDIVPPVEAFAGLNWDAAGQAAHAAGCAPVAIARCDEDPSLTADDPSCTPPADPEPCAYDPYLTADDPSCTPPADPEPCAYDPNLTADDPGCTPPVDPEPCQYDPNLTADDPTCTPPADPDPCSYDANLTADDPSCTPPADPEPCEYDPNLAADDPGCTPPVDPEPCQSDPNLTADDPDCVPQVGNESETPPPAAPPSGDPGSPDGVLPTEGGGAPEQGVAAGAVGAGLPRTGGSQGALAMSGLLLVLLGVAALAAQHATRSQGAHFEGRGPR